MRRDIHCDDRHFGRVAALENAGVSYDDPHLAELHICTVTA